MKSLGYSDEMIQRVFVVNLQDDILVGVPASMLDIAFIIVEEIVWAAGHDRNPKKTKLWMAGLSRLPPCVLLPELR